MFSNLGPLFKTTFRQAESNDTRQNIPHDERDKGRKKREEEERQETQIDPWNDSTSVSVEALRTFLVNFLKTLPEVKESVIQRYEKPQDTFSTRPHESKRPTNTHNAKAVRAYQNMADHSITPRPQMPEAEKNNPRRVTADMMESQELRDAYQLIDDLDGLAARGVERLYIPKADDFLESLKAAISFEKSRA